MSIQKKAPSVPMGTVVLMRVFKILHLVISVALFALCWKKGYSGRYYTEAFVRSDWLVVLLYAVIVYALNRVYNAYDLGYVRKSELVYSQSLGELIAAAALYAVSCLMWLRWTNPLPFVLLLAAQTGFNILWCLAARPLYIRGFGHKKTVVIYGDESALRRIQEVRSFREMFDVQKYIENPADDIHALIREMEGYDAVFVSGIPATLRNGIVKYCIEAGVPGYFAPLVGDVIMNGARHLRAFSVPVFNANRADMLPEYRLVKRAADIIVSLIGIVLTGIFMLVTALAVKLYDGGPVFYRQTRLTKDGKEFRIIKFRSMRVDAEKDGVARLATDKDDRITPVGRVIRACRLDELPQLFNILKGDMSLVGPRPERPEIAAQYEEMMPAFSLRLQVKAGLTGFAQVYGRYNTDPYDKLQMDLMYINQMSFFCDLMLLFATIRILFLPSSTSGIEEGQVTAAHTERKEKL